MTRTSHTGGGHGDGARLAAALDLAKTVTCNCTNCHKTRIVPTFAPTATVSCDLARADFGVERFW